MSGPGSDETPGRPPVPRTDLTPLVAAVETAGADAFVAVGDRFDDDLRYLTRVSRTDHEFAVVVIPDPVSQSVSDDRSDDESDRDQTGDESDRDRSDDATAAEGPLAVLLAPRSFTEEAERAFIKGAREERRDDETVHSEGDRPFHDGVARDVSTEHLGEPAGERAAAVGTDLVGSDAELLVPRSIPHDAAVYLESAGHAIASTPAVAEARARKTPAELDCLRFVQGVAVAGMTRAETILAESDSDGDHLRWNGATLTTEHLRREVNAVLGAGGVSPADNTVIGVGPSLTDRHGAFGADPVPLRPGETVPIEVAPRGPNGYHGQLARTFVVDGDGGWERRASVACEAARRVALDEIEAGAAASTVTTEALAEIGAYGFDPGTAANSSRSTDEIGHGAGLSRREAPSLSGTAELRSGHVITVEPGVSDGQQGCVRIGDLLVVTEDGYDLLAEYPLGIVPATR